MKIFEYFHKTKESLKSLNETAVRYVSFSFGPRFSKGRINRGFNCFATRPVIHTKI